MLRYLERLFKADFEIAYFIGNFLKFCADLLR